MTLIFQNLLLKDFIRDKICLYNQNSTISRQAIHKSVWEYK